ncbi:MAG: M1 family peptidase, partial [Bacteroidetes bacterium]
MKKYWAFFFIGLATSSLAQSKDYFQQEVNYEIHVSLDDINHTLSGYETFVYKNNSPDTLHYLWIHIWPNAYKNNKTALAKQLVENGETDFYFAPPKDKGFIDSLNFTENGKPIRWEYHPEHIDICKIHLQKPLLPGESTVISTPFFVKIPLGIFSRLGHIEQQYQITQWYPKPAVYDKNGWHEMPYLNQGEFYSEFGTYDVFITLPENYVVGATGDLVNGEAELARLDSIAEATAKIEAFSTDMSFPPSSKQTKTLHYHQINVHDFAWFADKRYHVLKGEVTTPHTGHKVTTWAMFTNSEPELWKNSIEYLDSSIYYYSLWNGDYPYNHVTAVDGALSAGAGMEYPNITVIGKSQLPFMLETVIMHEVGHNWFYGMLGSNEREHPWMDEGLNSFNENRYIETRHPDANLLGMDRLDKVLKFFDLDYLKHKDQYYLGYLMAARQKTDQPVELPANEYTFLNYGTIVYGKSALIFDYLMAYLGEEKMTALMQKYFQEWHFKHPQPEDFKHVFTTNSDKNIDWFFNDLMRTTKVIDYKIAKYSPKKQLITVKNKGQINAPVQINGIKDGSIVKTVWLDGFDKKQTVDFQGDYDLIKIDATNDIPEINRRNNTVKTKGLLKKTEPFRLQFLGSIENPNKTSLYWMPSAGWNNYDKTFLGLALYNTVFPIKNFNWFIAPNYSFATKMPVGIFAADYRIYSHKSIFHLIKVGVKGKQFSFLNDNVNFAYYSRINPYLHIDFKKYHARSNVQHKLKLSSVYVTNQIKNKQLEQFSNQTYDWYHRVVYTLENNHTLFPFDYSLQLEQHSDFVKASFEYNQYISYSDATGMNIRLFAGKFLQNNSSMPYYNWRMDGSAASIGGYSYDYAYDYYLLGRTENSGLLSQQMIFNQGGFKAPTSSGSSNDWLASLNISSDIHEKLPFQIFADAGMSSTQNFMYDAGISL